MSNYLNNYSDYISKADIEEIVSKDIDEEKAFAIILANGMGLDILDKNVDKDIFNEFDKQRYTLKMKLRCNAAKIFNFSLVALNLLLLILGDYLNHH